jgi:hypothetical protein
LDSLVVLAVEDARDLVPVDSGIDLPVQLDFVLRSILSDLDDMLTIGEGVLELLSGLLDRRIVLVGRVCSAGKLLDLGDRELGQDLNEVLSKVVRCLGDSLLECGLVTVHVGLLSIFRLVLHVSAFSVEENPKVRVATQSANRFGFQFAKGVFQRLFRVKSYITYT